MNDLVPLRRRFSRTLAALAALLCLALGACGGSGGNAGSRTAKAVHRLDPKSPLLIGTVTTSFVPAGQPIRGDGDADNPADLDGNGDDDGSQDKDDDRPTAASYRFPDGDDKAALSYGRPAHGAQRQAIAAVVERYYSAARTGDGEAGCALLVPQLARTVVEDYAGGAGPSYLRSGRTCAEVLALLFAHDRAELARPVTVIDVGVDGARAGVVVGSRTLRASQIFLIRMGRTWRVQGLFGVPLP